jgi:hypothetical protein
MKKYILYLILVVSVLFTYRYLPMQFFQQDEWHHLGQEYIWHEKGIITFFFQDAVSPVGIRFLPLGYLLNYIQYSAFGSNPLGYSVVSLCFHLVNTFLVFLVINKLIKKEKIAFFAALFFGVWASHQQAVTWLIQHSTTLPALTFSLLAIYFFENSKLVPLLLLIFAAIFFKETAYFIFPFLILLPLIHGKNVKQLIGLKTTRIIFAAGLIYLLILIIFSYVQPKSQTELFIPKTGFVQTFERRLFSIPLRSISQSIIQEPVLLEISKKITVIPIIKTKIPEVGTTQYDIFVEQSLSKKLMYLFSLLVIITIALVLLVIRKKTGVVYFRKGLFISIMFVLLGSFPLMFISTLAGNFTFLESRYLYIINVGVVLMIGFLANYIFEKNKYLGCVFVLFVVFINSQSVSKALLKQVELGRTRKNILSQIKNHWPTLPKRVVFYTESDKAYYGLPSEVKIMPFQSGFGQTLLVWYQGKEKFPSEFNLNDFLWNIDSQGYKEIGDRGYGYFRDKRLLFKTIKDANLSAESIISLSFNSTYNKVSDISKDVWAEYLKTK